MTKLQSGKTLGEIADATTGKSKAGLIAALVADEKSHLAQAVKDGRLTQAQADTMAANLESRITDLVNGKLPPHPDGPRPGDGHRRGTAHRLHSGDRRGSATCGSSPSF